MLDDWINHIYQFFQLDTLNVLTFLWLGFFTVKALNGMAKGERYSIFFPIVIHFIFGGVHLLLDVLVGKPEYSSEINGLYNATRDDLTCVIYCLYVGSAATAFWYLGRGKASDDTKDVKPQAPTLKPAPSSPAKSSNIQKLLFGVSFIILILPILAWLTSPNPSLYSTYGVGSGGLESSASFLLSIEEFEHYSKIISPLTQFSLLGAIVIVALQPKFNPRVILFVLPFLVSSSWLNGKRNIPTMAAFVFLYIFWEKGWLRGKKFIIACISVLLAFSLFTHSYQQAIRSFEKSADPTEYYTAVRVDFGRDHTIKLAIYSEFHPEKAILDYRGQSYLFYLTLFVPRSVWPDKPVNYAIYISQAAIERTSLYGRDGWVLTTSILDEAIANFSWAGMIIGPLIVCLICRVGDSCKNSFLNALTNLIATLLLVVDLNVFWPLFLMWLIGVFTVRFNASKKVMQGST